MANKKISALTAKTTLDTTDNFVIAESTSANKKIARNNVTKYLGTKILNEAAIADTFVISYDSGSGELIYVAKPTTNATHTGEVTGATTLTVDSTAISNKSEVTPIASDFFLVTDGSDSGNLKKVDAKHMITGGTASYTPSETTETIDLETANIHIITTSSATGNITLTLDNALDGQSWLFEVVHGATARSLIFPVGTVQSGALGNTVTASGNNQEDRIAVAYNGTKFSVSKSENYA